jgi:ketosteroid isomerase-like protein
MGDAMDTEDLKIVAAKLAITEALTRYCRGIDRCDIDALKSSFWPDAVANYGQADQNAWEWGEATLKALRTMERTQHAISNILIDVAASGDRATGETYCRAYHEVKTDGGVVELMVGGRYLDRFEKRGREWRIARRDYVMDFNQNGPSTSEWTTGIYAGLKRVGLRAPEDPLYRQS